MRDGVLKEGTTAGYMEICLDIRQPNRHCTGMNIETRRKIRAILSILQQFGNPMGSIQLADKLQSEGIHLNSRMIRNYLKMMDEAGFTENLGRRGRRITERGCTEVESTMAIDKVGVVSTRIDECAFRMSFDLSRRLGSVVLNVSLINESQLESAVAIMSEVMKVGLGVGRLAVIRRAGESIAEFMVPPGKAAIGTISTVTINGILLKVGIPVASRFGGLLEYRNGNPFRVTQFIEYSGSTLDPFEVFSRGRMTDVLGATRTGDGIIGISFREVPAAALSSVNDTVQRLAQIGLNGVIRIGEPHQPLFDIPVRQGMAAMVVTAGLNPTAALQESGIVTESIAMAGLFEFGKLSELESNGLG